MRCICVSFLSFVTHLILSATREKISLCAPNENNKLTAFWEYACVLRIPLKTTWRHSELVTDAILEDQIVDIWTDYLCLYDVRSPEFKNRDSREHALYMSCDVLPSNVYDVAV